MNKFNWKLNDLEYGNIQDEFGRILTKTDFGKDCNGYLKFHGMKIHKLVGFAFVHNPKSKMQGIGIKSGKYHGVIYEYKNVSFGTLEDEPDKEVILSFEYNVIDSFGFDREDFGKQELCVYLQS